MESKNEVTSDKEQLKFVYVFICQQEICKKLQQAIDKIDEARYDTEAKVQKADTEVRGTR